jgi:peptidoglycan/LPS O-acetylase OafA/YrhL
MQEYVSETKGCALRPGIGAEKVRVSALDSVRAVAILAVVATHSLSATVAVTQSFAFPKSLFIFFDFGQFGVPVFFALSGWLIFSLYYKQEKPATTKHYWSRRFARIWPLWAVFVVVYFIIYDIDTEGLPTWTALLLCLTFLGWTAGSIVAVPLGGLTIQQEMGHYLVFWLLRKRGIETFLASVLVGYVSFYLVNWLVNSQTLGPSLNPFFNAWLRLGLFGSWPFFVLGGVAYLGFKWLSQSHGEKKQQFLSPTGGILLVLVLLFGSQIFYSQETPGYFVMGYVLFAALLGVALNQIPLINRIFWSIGRYSYFMYFFHFLVLRQLEKIIRDWGVLNPAESMNQNIVALFSIFIAATIISWAAAWVSWKVYEYPIMRLVRKRFP